jgi:hypothetical protein
LHCYVKGIRKLEKIRRFLQNVACKSGFLLVRGNKKRDFSLSEIAKQPAPEN